MTEFTPRPWQINHDDGEGHYLIGPKVGENVSMAFEKADARLIAAAPDLLAALERLIHACSTGDYRRNGTPRGVAMPSRDQVDEARTAIAKARNQ